MALAITLGCGRPPGVPESSSETSQKLPFDREPNPHGTSPSQSLVPPNRIPAGTSVTVRLSAPISSASAHAGDTFAAALDDPVVVDDQTLLPRTAQVSGRVIEAKPSVGVNEPGYVRIVLVSVSTGDKTIAIETSSIFAKAPREELHSPTHGSGPVKNDVVLTAERRLTFRLSQAITLP
jgi:hypothetical protein